MKTGHQFWLALILTLILVTGCSGGDNSAANPVSPGVDVNQTPATLGSQNPDSHLLGYYEITIDPETCTATVNVSRHAVFTVNIMGIINQNPAFLGIQINKITPGAGYIDVDVDISLAHPLPGFPEFNCYDARGVFMGDGSAVLDYNNDLVYPVFGTDQYMLDDPDDHDGGGPDGYTRWYNFTEFGPSISDVPLFAYTPGPLSTPDFNGTATLNPYKYYTDSLASVENLWAFLQSHGDMHGIFSQSNSVTRNYYIRFPTANPLEFGFAFIVDWEGPDIHPANAEEAVACKAEIANDLYFESITTWGGDLIMDVSVFDWDAVAPPTGPMEQYNIYLESNVLNTPHQLDDTEMTPVSGGVHWSTYHVELPTDLISSIDGNEVWVIVEYPDSNYQNVAGVPNLADTDFLAAFFRYDLPVSSQMDNDDPVCNMFIDPGSPMPAEGWDVGIPIMFDASGSYDPDGDPITFEWDFDGDSIFGEDPDDLYTGDPDTPTYIYTFSLSGAVSVKVSDDKGGESICSVNVDITTFQSKNIPLREGVIPLDIGVRETNGDLWVLYEDTEVWVYVRDNWYQYGVLQYALPDDGYSFDIEYMDIAPTGYLGVGAGLKYKIFSPGGSMVDKIIFDEAPVLDVANHGISEGIYSEALSFLMGKTIESDPPGNPYVRHYWYMLTPPTYVYDYYTNWCGYHYDESSGYGGINKTFYEWIKAIEADVDGESIWVIEQPDYRCTRWYKNSWFMVFGGEYFGDGTDNSWVDLRDMARDPNNRFMVLDYENETPLIKVFIGDLDGGAYIGSFGDSDSINGDPIRIDGSDFDGLACVLHDDTAGISGSWLLSVFLPEEMP